MNQEEREAFTKQTTQHMVASLHLPTNAEQTIRPLLTKYGVEMFAAGVRTMEEWIRRSLASLPIPIVITRTDHDPVLAYH